MKDRIGGASLGVAQDAAGPLNWQAVQTCSCMCFAYQGVTMTAPNLEDGQKEAGYCS